MRMSWKERFCALLLIASLGACETAKVGYDYDRRINFQAYRTYEWMPGDQERTGDRRIDNAAVDIRIRLAVAAQLRLKGYSEPVSGPPDFYVAYHVGLKDVAPDVSSQYYSPGMAGEAFLAFGPQPICRRRACNASRSRSLHDRHTARRCYRCGLQYIGLAWDRVPWVVDSSPLLNTTGRANQNDRT